MNMPLAVVIMGFVLIVFGVVGYYLVVPYDYINLYDPFNSPIRFIIAVCLVAEFVGIGSVFIGIAGLLGLFENGKVHRK